MLPVSTDYAPMEAQLIEAVPQEKGWEYEPKWDGFRCLVFRDGDEISMRSKNGLPLDRYFPEVVEALKKLRASKFVLDGELVIKYGDHFSFDDLLQRIHPAASRIKKLSLERPATLILFDLLVDAKGVPFTCEPIEVRRRKLDEFAHKYLAGNQQILLSPSTTDMEQVKQWWRLVGEGLDGIVAKRLGVPYQSGNRKGMVKIKKHRTADCVVGGFRYASKAPVVGSLLLGLYDTEGKLDHVGFCSSFNAEQKRELTKKLEPLIQPPGFTGNAPGGPSRWSTERSGQWEPLRPVLIVEVQYDHFTGDRFRHGTKFLRWRPDKAPRQCTFEQVQPPKKGTARLLREAS